MTEQLYDHLQRGTIDEYRIWRDPRGGWCAMVNDMATGETGRTVEQATDSAIAAWLDAANSADVDKACMVAHIQQTRRD